MRVLPKSHSTPAPFTQHVCSSCRASFQPATTSSVTCCARRIFSRIQVKKVAGILQVPWSDLAKALTGSPAEDEVNVTVDEIALERNAWLGFQ